MDESNKLAILLEQAGQYHPLYGRGLATHIPMVMIALNRLNASNKKIETIFNENIKDLEDIGSLENIKVVGSINSYLGESKKFRRYLKYFKNELKGYGAEVVLKKALPVLIPGIAASAFHCLIRLAYAIEANSQSEIAIALAYWCAEFQSFELSDVSSDETLEDILTRLVPIGVKHKFSPGIIVNRMAEVGELLKKGGVTIQPSSLKLSNIRNFAVKAFYAKNDFTLLHTVTGCHAFSIIMPYLENVDIALQELWKAIVVAYLSTGLNYANTEIPLSGSSLNFDSIISNTLETNDSHIIKLVYTCLCEYRVRKDPIYIAVAKRAVLGKLN